MLNNKNYYCYILRNTHNPDKNRTYNGFTVNPKNRLRQHNGELVGGARYTKRFGSSSWEIYALVKGFPNQVNALQCEWRIKHPTNKKRRPIRFTGPEGRIKGLNRVLHLPQWTNSSTINNNTMNLDVWIVNEFAHLLTNLPANIRLHTVEEIDLDNV